MSRDRPLFINQNVIPHRTGIGEKLILWLSSQHCHQKKKNIVLSFNVSTNNPKQMKYVLRLALDDWLGAAVLLPEYVNLSLMLLLGVQSMLAPNREIAWRTVSNLQTDVSFLRTVFGFHQR